MVEMALTQRASGPCTAAPSSDWRLAIGRDQGQGEGDRGDHPFEDLGVDDRGDQIPRTRSTALPIRICAVKSPRDTGPWETDWSAPMSSPSRWESIDSPIPDTVRLELPGCFATSAGRLKTDPGEGS